MPEKIWLQCKDCGGGADAILNPGENTAATECACGRVLLYAKESSSDGGVLSLQVDDGVKTHDKFGG